jgi:hypothetical protein
LRRTIGLVSLAAAAATALGIVVPAGESMAGTSQAAAALPAISVAMNGKTITVTGALQSGAVQVVSTVPAKHDSEPMFIRLNPGATYAQFWQVFATIGQTGDPNAVGAVGSIVFNTQAGPGTSSAQTSLQPGQYIGFDSEASNPAKWPWTEFSVSQATSPATLPRAKATIAAIEFGFTGPGKLHRGDLVQFANHGYLIHMVVAARAKNLATAKKLAAALKAGKDREANQLADGFADFLDPASHGAFLQEKLTARAGYWVFACFMDTQDGREHTRLGMERIIQIVN